MFRCKKCGRTSGTVRLHEKCSFCDYVPEPVKDLAYWEKLRVGYEEVQMVESSIENAYPEAYRLARKFHELYEAQAPFFGYITNPNTKEFYPNSNNARLMAYVCYHIVKEEKEKSIKEVLLKYKEAFEKAGLNFDGTLTSNK